MIPTIWPTGTDMDPSPDPYSDLYMYSDIVSNDTSNSSTDVCQNSNYIPTVQQYREALGGYGVAFITIGSITTAVLYLLFFQQMWFTFSNTHKVYRRHIYWIISIYPFVTLMSTLSMVVPRAYDVCTAVKITYMSIGVGHFADLTVLMYGSENSMIDDLKDVPLQLNVLPLCCWCSFLPSPPTSKRRLSLLKWMVWQLKWTQAIYFFIRTMMRTSMEDQDGKISPDNKLLWLNILNFASFLAGVYALNIINAISFDKLRNFRYRSKSFAIKLLILTTKLQAFLFDILHLYSVFPCLGPNITSIVFKNTLLNSLLLVEMPLFGVFSYLMYRRPEFREEPGFVRILSSLKAQQEEHGASGQEAANNGVFVKGAVCEECNGSVVVEEVKTGVGNAGKRREGSEAGKERMV